MIDFLLFLHNIKSCIVNYNISYNGVSSSRTMVSSRIMVPDIVQESVIKTYTRKRYAKSKMVV